MGEQVSGWFLADADINDLQRASLIKLLGHAKRARWTNVVVRKDGQEAAYEADWIKHIVQTQAISSPSVPSQLLADVVWAASERDKGNRIREFDHFMDKARAALAVANRTLTQGDSRHE